MKTEWKDITSYSRGDKERNPTSWALQTDLLTITVTNGHIWHKGEWVMHCHALGIDTKPIPSEDMEHAKRNAVEFVKKRLAKLTEEIKDL